MNVTGLYLWSVNISSGNGLSAIRQQAIIWANVDPDFCRHVVSLDQNELIGVIALVLQDIHHNTSWIWTQYENKIKYMLFLCTQSYFYIIFSHFQNMMW